MSKSEWKNFNQNVPVHALSTNTSCQHACITLNSSDRLRLICFPPAIINAVRQALETTWSRGIKNEQQYNGAHEFKLNGNPWHEQKEEAVPARIMMMTVLSALHHHGWYLLTSTDVSKKAEDKGSIIFKLGVSPPPTSFFAVSFNEWDKLCLISAPSDLIPAVSKVFGQANIQREEWRDNRAAYQFKLRGNPWLDKSDDVITTRIQLLALLDCFASFGWQLHASIGINITMGGSEVDTWFFRRNT